MFSKFKEKYSNISLPAKAGVWFTLCSIVQRGISVLSMPIFTRLLSTEAYGTYSLYTSWSMLFSLVITLNLASEVFNKGLVDHESEREGFSTSQLGLLSVMVAAFYAVYFLLKGWINSVTGMDTVLTSFMFLEIYSSAIVGLWSARKRFEYSYVKLISVTLGISVTSVLLGIVAVWMAPDDLKVLARVVSNVAPFFVCACGIAVAFLRASTCIINLSWWKRSICLGVPLVPHYASQVFLNQADKILIGWFMGAAQVAIYGIAHSAGLLLVMVNNGVNSSYVPWLYGKLRSRDVAGIAGVSNVLATLVLLLVFALMLLAPECVAVLASSDYQEAIWAIPPIATGVVFSFLYTLFVNVEIYYGETGYVAIASAGAAILNILLNLVAIPRFGYIASAYVTSACYLFTAIFHYALMRRTLEKAHIDENVYDFKFLALLCCLTVACMLASLALYALEFVRYLFIFALLLALFLYRKRAISVLFAVKRGGK